MSLGSMEPLTRLRVSGYLGTAALACRRKLKTRYRDRVGDAPLMVESWRWSLNHEVQTTFID